MLFAASTAWGEEQVDSPVFASPTGVGRYARGTSYEVSWTYGAVAFAPGVWAGGLRLRETNGPVVTAALAMGAMMGSQMAVQEQAKDDYQGGKISREEAIKRINEGERRNLDLLKYGFSGAFFDTDITIFSDKFGGATRGFDLRAWIGKHLLDAGISKIVFEWGLKTARIWGPAFRRPDEKELFDHAHLGGTVQLRADVSRWAELSLRWEPNLLRLDDAKDHESPLYFGASVDPIEGFFVGGEAVWTSLPSKPAGMQLTVGVRL